MDFWSPYREWLSDGFDELCGYTVMWTPNGTVDHFIPWAVVRGTKQAYLAYEWTNLRYSVGWFNSARKSTAIPDPHTVHEDWFELLLPSLELIATAQVPPAEIDRVNSALKWLGRDPRVIKVRRAFFQQYQAGLMTIELLDRWAPLISRALRRQPVFLHPRDLVRHQTGTL